LGFNFALLNPEDHYYACGYDYYGSGGWASTGGTTSTGGGEVGGYAGEYSEGGGVSAGGSAPYPEYPEEPTYDEGMAGSVGAGGWIGAGGSPATGGYGGGPSPGSWCEGMTSGFIAGVSYAVGPCTQSQLRLPLRFQEPEGWYELRVFGGYEACERGALLFETSGYGVGGAEVEVPVNITEDIFVSIELTTESWSYGEAAVELTSLPGGE
jgi:hypothetical protein